MAFQALLIPGLLLATAAVVFGSKPKRSGGGGGSDDGGVDALPAFVIDIHEIEYHKEVGALCAETPRFVYGVYNQEGECVIFWDEGAHAPVFRNIAQDTFEDMGSPADLCSTPYYEQEIFFPGTFKEQVVGVLRPALEAFVIDCLVQLYPDAPSTQWPPRPPDLDTGESPSPLWVQIAWKRAAYLVLSQICDFEPVT